MITDSISDGSDDLYVEERPVVSLLQDSVDWLLPPKRGRSMMVHTIRRPSFWASRDYLHNTYCDVERVMAELASIAFNVEERTQDRIRALELLAKHGGAFVERSEIKVQAHYRRSAGMRHV